MFRKYSRQISAVVLCFFTWTSGGVYSLASAAQIEPHTQQIKNITRSEAQSAKATVPEHREERLSDSKSGVPEKAHLQKKKAEIDSLDREIRKQFAETEKKLNDANLPSEILERHQKFIRHYDQNLAELKLNLEKADRAKDKAEAEAVLDKATEHLKQAKSPSKHKALHLNHLPNRQTKKQKREPRLRKEDYQHDLQKDKQAWKSEKRIMIASVGSLAGILATTAVNTANGPSDADLAETIDAQLTPEIRAKAAELDNSPVRIYEWLRNNIDYVPTWGSIQGSQMTLLTKQGNAFDTASLLVALLRAAGIHARYVQGTIELPVDKAMNWAGGFTDPAAAIDFMQSGGIPVKPMTEGGTITKAQLEHVWVEAYVDYFPSRGAKHIQGKGDTWIALDPSYKQYSHKPGLDITHAVPQPSRTLLDAALASGTTNVQQSYATGLNCGPVQEAVNQYQASVVQYLGQKAPDATVGDFLGSADRISEEFPYLLGTLPYTVVATGNKLSELPDSVRYGVKFSLTDENGQSLEIISKLPEIAGKKISLDFRPASQADADTVAAFGRAPVPAYLVSVSPELRIDGAVSATGQAIGLGRPATLSVTTKDPDGTEEVVPVEIAAGEHLVFAVDSGRVAPQSLQSLKQRLEATRQKFADQQQPTKDEVLGDALYAAALAYFAQLDTIGQIRAKTQGFAATRLPSIAFASARLDVTTSYGVPLSAKSAGLTVELVNKVAALQNLDGSRIRQLQEIFIDGFDASLLTRTVSAELFSSSGSVSAVTALQAAKDAGIPIYTVNPATIDGILPALQLSPDLKTAIANAVNSGKSVIVTGSPVTAAGWTGTAWVIVDPATGDSAWLLGEDNRGAVLHPAWSDGAIGLIIGDDTVSAQLAATASAMVSQPLVDGIFAVENGVTSLASGIPTAYLDQLTSGQFYRLVTDQLGCYFSAAVPTIFPTVPGAACMGAFLQTLCIPSGETTVSTGNTKPVAMAGPNLTAVVGDNVPLDGSGSSDADHNALTYHWSFAARPDGSAAVIANATSAGASFIPDKPGTYQVSLVVGDGVAFSDPAVVTVTATHIMVPVPDVTGQEHSVAETTIARGKLSVGAITASPSDTIPAGMIVAQNPLAGTDAPKGSPVDLVVSTGPAVDKVAPLLDLQFNNDPPVYGEGEEAIVTVTASDDSGTVNVTLLVDGQPVALASGIARIDTTGYAIGSTHTVIATAVDPSGNQAVKTVSFGIKDPADTSSPEVAILSPAADKELIGPTTLVGTVKAAHLLEYTLAYSPAGEGNYTTFATGTSQVTNGSLGTFDPTTLKNGVYDIRLSAVDVNGRRFNYVVPYAVTGNQKVGLFSLTFTDLEIPVSGIPVTVNRTYDSRDKKKGDFGVGWNLDLNTITIRPNRSIGETGWQYTKNPGTFNPTYNLNTGLPRFVTVTFGDGRTEVFDLVASQRNGDPSFWPAPTMVAREGNTSKLQIVDGDQTLILNGGNLYNSDYTIYNPTAYQLTTKEGTVYQLSVKDGLRSVREPGGNTLTVTPAGVTHSAGVSLSFVRDTNGRISRIIRPDGAILKYDYDLQGNLSTYTDAGGNTTRYSYAGNSNLTDIISPLGRRYVKNEYDATGRLVATIDPQGKRIEYTHDTNSRQEVVRDRNGKITVYEYDANGNVTAITDPDGGRTTAVYDALNNKTRETDAVGNTTEWAYDAKRNVLSETKTIDGIKAVTSYTYNALGKVLTVTDPMGRVTTNTYDAAGRLLTTKDPLGNIARFTYDSRGNVLTTTDSLGNVTTNTYDALGRKVTETTAAGITKYGYDKSGNKTSETDAKGNITTYAYDPNGKLTATTDALGNVTRYEYDANGNKIAEADPLGNRTTYAYDSANRLILTTYADGTTTATSYDNEGNVATRTDQSGTITRYTYNAKKQLTRTDYADGTFTETGYDKAGRMVSTTDAKGKTSSTEYDSLNRVTRKTNAEGHATRFEYDLNGNQKKQIDANGHETLFDYDDNNRLIKTTLAGGQTTRIEYDAAGRKTAETDAANNTTKFGYDALGRLETVTDALNQQTKYEYDANGNRTAIVDANNHRTTFDYDELNRIITKTMPNGGVERYFYDTAGRQTAKIDAKGQKIEYVYDNRSRLASRSYPDGSSVTFSYTPTGKRNIVTDSRGETRYTYNTRNRLTEVTNPDGKTIGYGYDLSGRIASITSFAGTISYEYSDSGRLSTVTDPAGRPTTYSYDAAGNRTGLSYPNGTSAGYSYDVNNRLTLLTHDSRDSRLASYSYTLGAIGNRTRIDEASGISRAYTYDKLYRLKKEEVTDSAGAQSYTNDFGYDAVGNRQNKTYTASSVVSTDYTYNAADQLVTENGISYTYDLNGSLTSKTDGSGTTTYSYDFDNRMVRVASPSGTTTYVYDFDGNRIESATATETDRYLVDTNRNLSQVMAEYKLDGALIASYTYADDLISMTRGGQTYWYQFDGLGSTRLLTDGSGAVTDTYDYDAFGNFVARIGITDNPFLFTGQHYDANSGFYHLRARYYQTKVGRFTSLDPWAGDIYAPSTLQKYLYTRNDPVNRIDPNGMMDGTLGGFSAIMGLSLIIITIATLTKILPKTSSDNDDNSGDIVYRGLDKSEHWLKVRLLGIQSKGFTPYTPSEHIEHRRNDTLWISTSRDVTRAAIYASTGNGWIAQIDLKKVSSVIFDTTIKNNLMTLTPVAQFNANIDKEVLIEGNIPAKAIISTFKTSDI